MDPISLTASIIAFLEVAQKFKESLDKISENQRQLAALKADVLLGLYGLEGLLPADCASIAPLNRARLKADLDNLRSQLEHVHRRCEKQLTPGRPSKSMFSDISLNVKSLFQHKAIEGEITQLEKQVNACYNRFLIVSSVTTQCVALRTEQQLVLSRAEQRDHMARIETAFTRMVVENEAANRPALEFCASAGIAANDLNFLSQQIEKLVNIFDRKEFSDMDIYEEPCEGGYPWPIDPWGLSNETFFNCALSQTCLLINFLGNYSDDWPLQSCGRALLFLGKYLFELGLLHEAADSFQLAVCLYNNLHAGHPSFEYQRGIAYGLRLIGHIYQNSVPHSKYSLETFQALYDASGDVHDLEGVKLAIQTHTVNMIRGREWEDALDIAQQALVLSRHYSSMRGGKEWDKPMVTWQCSGEANVVYTSERVIYSSSGFALDEAIALWNLAHSLSLNGQYEMAHIAGVDAVNCLQAVLLADPWYADAARGGLAFRKWQAQLAAWVPVTRCLSPAGASIKEVDDDESSSDI